MRNLLAANLLAATAIAVAVTAAAAADLPADYSDGASYYTPAPGERSGTLVIYDVSPGTVVRAYWQAPWRNRHYYPRTGERPEIGRDEDLSAPSDVPPSPQSYRRYWSTTSAFAPAIPNAPRASQLTGPLK